MIVLSVDPGAVHCGVALWHNQELHDCYERTPSGLLEVIHAGQYSLDTIVIESFSLSSPKYDRSKGKEAVETLELIGMVRGYAELMTIPIYKQQPSLRLIAQRGMSYRNLKMDAKWGRKLRNDHVASAVSHGLYFWEFNPKSADLRAN